MEAIFLLLDEPPAAIAGNGKIQGGIVPPTVPASGGDALDELARQAQELGMGY